MSDQEKKEVTMTNALDSVRIKNMLLLNSKNNADLIHITNLEKEMTGCTHRYDTEWYVDPSDKTIGIIKLKCSICGDEFKFMPTLSEDYVEQNVEEMNNIIQTIKTMWLNLPADKIEEFFIMSAYINKLPEMLKLAKSSFEENETMKKEFYKKIGMPGPTYGIPYIPAQGYCYGRPGGTGIGYAPYYGYNNPSNRHLSSANNTDPLYSKLPDAQATGTQYDDEDYEDDDTIGEDRKTEKEDMINNILNQKPDAVILTPVETKPKRKYTKKDKTSEIDRVYPRE